MHKEKRLAVHIIRAFLKAQLVYNAWRIPGSEAPGGLASMGSHRVGHD